MTTAAERAETYLRLMAESELRRALAYPRYRAAAAAGAAPGGALGGPPFPPAARPAAPPGPVRGPALRPAAGVPVAGVPVAGGPYRGLGGPADAGRPGRRAGPVADAARPAGGAAAAWPATAVSRSPRPRQPWAGCGQVASALVMAGTISEAAARTVLDSLTDALALRGKLAAGPAVPARLAPGRWGPGSPWRPGSPPPPLPGGGPVRAVPIGSSAAPRARRVPGRGSPARPGPGPGPGGAHRGRGEHPAARLPSPGSRPRGAGRRPRRAALRPPHRRR